MNQKSTCFQEFQTISLNPVGSYDAPNSLAKWLVVQLPPKTKAKISKSTPLLLLPPQKKTLIKKMEKKTKKKLK
jgi:hypothetical protein